MGACFKTYYISKSEILKLEDFGMYAYQTFELLEGYLKLWESFKFKTFEIIKLFEMYEVFEGYLKLWELLKLLNVQNSKMSSYNL